MEDIRGDCRASPWVRSVDSRADLLTDRFKVNPRGVGLGGPIAQAESLKMVMMIAGPAAWVVSGKL